jgi:uncharacterized damage-inducible protein DinB
VKREEYYDDIRHNFETYKSLADKSIARVTDDQFFATVGQDSNSIAVIVKHLAGNMHSRWRDFLTTDGEKPDRHRDTEFEIDKADTRESLLQKWESGWEMVFDAVEAARDTDPDTVITIRLQPFSLVGAFNRAVTHVAYHAGQIVILARQFGRGEWQSLSVPRGESERFNAEMRGKHGK